MAETLFYQGKKNFFPSVQLGLTLPRVRPSLFECHVTLCDLWLEFSIFIVCGSVPRFLSFSLSLCRTNLEIFLFR